MLFLLSASCCAQAVCPIEISKVNPHAFPFGAGMGDDKDPWDHYLQIEYKNTSGKQISAIKFGVVFISPLAEVDRSVYAYTSDQNVKPGKTAKPYWGDGVYFHQYGRKMGAGTWVEKIMFSDGSMFVGSTGNPCVFPRSVTPQAQPANDPLTAGIKENSAAAQSSPASANLAASLGHVPTKEEIAEMVKEGKASTVAVITNPPGADIFVDQNKIGKSPMVFNLIRLPDQPDRVVKVEMTGYKTVEKKITPDGNKVPIGIDLQRENQ